MPHASAPSRMCCALAVGHRRLVLVRLLVRLHVDGDDGVDCGVCGGRSGRLAEDPSPPVPGPSACSRAPAAATIWRRAVASHATLFIGLDSDFVPFLQNRDVQRSAYVDKVVVVAHVMGPL